VACAYLRAGKVDEALDLLQEHAEVCALQKDWLANDTDWDTVRDHPRFKAIEEMLASTDSGDQP
jgi:adenylate cyclase